MEEYIYNVEGKIITFNIKAANNCLKNIKLCIGGGAL